MYSQPLTSEEIAERTYRVELATHENKVEHWNVIKGWMLEIDWAGSAVLGYVRKYLFDHVEARLNAAAPVEPEKAPAKTKRQRRRRP